MTYIVAPNGIYSHRAATGNVVWLIQDEVVVRLEDRGNGQLLTTATRAVPGSRDATLVVDETTAIVGSLRLDLVTDNANRRVLQPGLSGAATIGPSG